MTVKNWHNSFLRSCIPRPVENTGQVSLTSAQQSQSLGVLKMLTQGDYNSGKPGKHGNLREFVNSGKLMENSGNLKFTQGIYDTISWASSYVHNCQ